MAPDYKKILEDLKKKNKSGTDFIQFEDGDTNIRILPGYPGMEGFFVSMPYHQKGQKASYVKVMCLNIEPGMDECEICRELVELRDSDDKEDKKAYKEQMAKDRYFFGAIERKPEGKGEVEAVAECGQMLLEEILKLLVNPDYEDLLDPVKGRDVTVNKSGEGMQTKYKATPRANPSPIIPGKPKGSMAFIGTDESDTKLLDIRKSAIQFEDEPENLMKVWNGGWKALKNDAEETPAKPAAKAPTKPALVKKPTPAPAESDSDEEGQESESRPITQFPKLKARDPITGDARYKTDEGIKTADGRLSPKGLAEGERPSKPSKAYLKEFPAPVEEVEETEEEEEVEEETAEIVTPVKKIAVKPKAPIEPDDDDGLEELDDILNQHSAKGKK